METESLLGELGGDEIVSAREASLIIESSGTYRPAHHALIGGRWPSRRPEAGGEDLRAVASATSSF